ncbi:MAG: hypothetical protein L0323_04810 [Planctomycetes bacterium]|nr:hypothetical protein [Planctomycetota bacterium]
MGETTGFQIRAYRPGDEDSILAGMARAIAREEEPSLRAPSEAVWRWRYLDAPDGSCIRLAVDPEGRVLAHFAGVILRVLVGGKIQRWVAVDDSFGDPSAAAGLGRHRPFLAAMRAFAQDFGGPPPDRHPVLYGLPTRRVLRFSYHLGLPTRHAKRRGDPVLDWEMVRESCVLRLDPGSPGEAEVGDVAVEETASFPEEVGRLFERAAAGWGALAVRDARFLNWRFAAHPEHRYDVGLARRRADGALLGYAVYRLAEFEGRREGLLCDWLVPAGEDGAAVALRRWGARRARADGASLAILIPDTAPEWIAFQEAGFRLHPARDFLAVLPAQRRLDANGLYRNWYTTLADFPRLA